MLRKWILLLTAFALSGCSSADKALCETSIKSELLNPETAEFLDFEKLNRPEYLASIKQSAAGALGERYGSTLGSSFIEGEAGGAAERAVAKLPENASFYRVRVKAAGKLGNTITDVQTCVKLDSECGCESTALSLE